MNRRIHLIIPILALVAALIAGCSGAGTTPAGNSTSPGGGTTTGTPPASGGSTGGGLGY